eukprot:m.69626 g.69626  ORF g.69626 m.69626 type:complete len:441 (+) comp14137_c0_seq1:415-1737(+)
MLTMPMPMSIGRIRKARAVGKQKLFNFCIEKVKTQTNAFFYLFAQSVSGTCFTSISSASNTMPHLFSRHRRFILLVIVGLIASIYIFSPSAHDNSVVDFDVDAVVTWVDASDTGWQKRYLASAHELGIEVELERMPAPRQYDELYYNVLGLIINTPWLRQVVLVTQRPQKPAYLEELRAVAPFPIRVVHHDEFIPEEYLPTFQSTAIEMQLDRIPGLSERFIYLNDDMIVLRPLQKSSFFNSIGKAIAAVSFPLPYQAWYHCHVNNRPFQCTMEYARQKLGRWLFLGRQHGAYTMTKSALTALKATLGPDEVAKTAAARHRNEEMISPPFAMVNMGHESFDLRMLAKPFKFQFLKRVDQLENDIVLDDKDLVCINVISPETPLPLQEKVFTVLEDWFQGVEPETKGLALIHPWTSATDHLQVDLETPPDDDGDAKLINAH